jgi:hypothetical protein
MKKKSSVITRPPDMDPLEQGSDRTVDLSEQSNRDAMLKLIRKGAPSVPPKEIKSSFATERTQFPLRVPVAIFQRVNQAVAGRDIPTPINSWIIEAILAQLKRENC